MYWGTVVPGTFGTLSRGLAPESDVRSSRSGGGAAAATRGWFVVAHDLASLPSLEDTLAVTNRTRRRSLLFKRERTLGPATLCADAIQWFLDTLGSDLETARHAGSFSAETKQHLTGVPCQKTVTMRLGSGDKAKTVAVTGIGDFEVGRDLARRVADAMGLSRSAAKNRTVNPSDIDAAHHCRLLPGIVSTFMPPAESHDLSWLDAVVVLTPSAGGVHPLGAPSRFTISASPFESLVVSSDRFSDLVNAYHVRFHPHVTVHEFPDTVTPTHPIICARSGMKLSRWTGGMDPRPGDAHRHPAPASARQSPAMRRLVLAGDYA